MIYLFIFILFVIAFASQPYLSSSLIGLDLNIYYTNATVTDGDDRLSEKLMLITKSNNNTFVILILSIILFVLFGCSFLTLFLNQKKINKLFNMLILLTLISIIIIMHVKIYNNVDYTVLPNLKTTETAGYGLTMTCTVLMFITILSSFMFHK
jgi:hypothetical protein